MKTQIQNVGRSLSAMVMPNLGAFIAWGLITAMFIPTGWLPNEKLGALVGPMITYLLPLLIGYTGGKMLHGARGGLVGAIATMGVIAGASIPMFLGAMIAGPLGGWCVKKCDAFLEARTPAGFEMLVGNFSAGILGGLLAVLCSLGIGPLAETATNALGAGVGALVDHKLLPFASLIVEPAKILFLNNAINHGVFTPLGAQQSQEIGRSIYYMIESNPGPGLGLLLAYCLAGKGSAKSSAGGAAVIHFLGGIHEIYFPYVLMNPVLILAMMGGGFTGVLVLGMLGGGLIAPASPGSIFAELMMTPKGAYAANVAGILAGGGVSFALSMLLLKAFGRDDADLDAAREKTRARKAESKGLAAAPSAGGARKIVFACDAGMGSSAMGATKLRKKMNAAGVSVTVEHAPVNEIPADAGIVVCHRDLAARAAKVNPRARLVTITDFLGAREYDALVAELKAEPGGAGGGAAAPVPSGAAESGAGGESGEILPRKNIALGLPSEPREAAIRRAGRMLVESGYVKEAYVEAMIARDEALSVAVGNSIAIPHGEASSKEDILGTGLVVLTYPGGVEWRGETVRVVIGIAATAERHIDMLGAIVDLFDTEDDVENFLRIDDAAKVHALLNAKRPR